MERRKNLEEENEKNRHLFREQTVVECEYLADSQYYPARIIQVLENDKFIVSYVDYDEQEEVSIDRLKLTKDSNSHRPRRSRSRSPKRMTSSKSSRNSRSRSRSRSPTRRNPLGKSSSSRGYSPIRHSVRDQYRHYK